MPRRRKSAWSSTHRGNTVFISRDEDGRTRTRIIIQKRSYLDPGTETLPGENVGNTSYVQSPTQHAAGVLDNTAVRQQRSVPAARPASRCRARTIPGLGSTRY